MYLPLHNVSRKKYFFRVPVTKLCFFTVSLPLLAFVICVLMTMYKDFENANNTHCKVPNVFPSISASIGNYEPQRTIWRTAINVHAPLRFFIVYLRGQYYKNVVRENCFIVAKLALFLNIMENIALIGLTHWTSSLHYPFHETCFKTFIGTSIFYMFFTCMMLTKYRRRPTVSNKEMYSVKLKWRAFFVNVGSFAFAAYFFLRHNKLCEPYVYSMFGFAEYIVVISNIIFHLTTVYDLQISYIYFTKSGLVIE
ncbi:post-GPI attachment to proteins factor 2 [Pectinophora gossypiella]|uniref:post-GPI attachment to proteins factor 2 n=1 Tax=Pectinophora gossypiella TaxID=13191 RepID=UPI00214EEB23|nr:post-GPI attachment to proteins factor 2 [Pectinophora gossypiella]